MNEYYLFANILQKSVDIDIFRLCVYRSLMLCHIHELCIAIRAYYEKDTTIKYIRGQEAQNPVVYRDGTTLCTQPRTGWIMRAFEHEVTVSLS